MTHASAARVGRRPAPRHATLPGAVAAAVTRGRSVVEDGEEVGLGWRAAMRAAVEQARGPDRFRPVRRLGVDETVSRRRRRFVTHLVDLDDVTVIATVEGRSAIVLPKALEAKGETWRTDIKRVAIDRFTPYAKAVRGLLPHARSIVDKLHVLRVFAWAVDQARPPSGPPGQAGQRSPLGAARSR